MVVSIALVIIFAILSAFSSWSQDGFSSSKYHVLIQQYPKWKEGGGRKRKKVCSSHTCPVTLEENPSQK